MKTLILVRHGKSSWDNSDVSDENRPLMSKGIMDAKRTAHLLHQEWVSPPQIWKTSIANRSMHTAILFAKEFNQVGKIRIHDELYTFDGNTLLRFIQLLNNEAESAILFVHNPATTQVVNLLGEQEFNNIPTSGTVVLKLNVDSWSNLPSKGNFVQSFYTPSNMNPEF